MQVSLCWSPEQCFIETMLGPIHLAPAHKPSCQRLPLCLGRAQSYQWFVWANPANPDFPHGHFVSLGSPPLIQSCRRKKRFLSCPHFFFALLLHTQIRWEESKLGSAAAPHLSLISKNIQVPNPAGDDVNRAGRHPRWNIGLLLLPNAILQGPTLCDE